METSFDTGSESSIETDIFKFVSADFVFGINLSTTQLEFRMERVLLFPRRQLSRNAQTQRHYLQYLDQEAKRQCAGLPLLSGDLYVRIVWFHKAPRNQDIDNIVKTILDGLTTIVYQDDNSIRKCLCEGVDTRQNYAISTNGIRPKEFGELSMMLGLNEHVILVQVGVMQSGQVVSFGPPV
jgi:Holliday junction resolvase RusA-like endonuclease